MNKLSKSAQTVLLLLDHKLVTAVIPKSILTKEVEKELLEFDLVTKEGDDLILTKKSHDVINNNAYIVKYPLSSEDGKVSNYNDVIKGMHRNAANSLGLAIVNEELYKKFSKFTNTKLQKQLEQAEYYYSLSDHPNERIRKTKIKVRAAQELEMLVIDEEFSKISNFELSKPILLGYNDARKEISLTQIKDGKLILNDGTELYASQLNRLNYIMKDRIVKQYYSSRKK